ncbi:MAG: glutaredoxin domain-containing protein [Candidatus Pacebacteria bacterium]|nr:glutaredoxin domain-containing protein [Candidatus Paceibacterota bacterium]
MMDKKIKVYSTPTCVYCVTLKEFFKEKGIEFEEVDVSLNEEAAREMIMKTGQMGVPVVEIGEEVIVGFDRDKIIQALGL